MRRQLPSPTGFSPHAWVKYCFGVVLVLIVLMASISSYDHHPDEANHLSAALYYIHHFLPPEIGDPEVRNTYSVWGISYLNYHWVEYFLAGKFILLTSPLIGDPNLAARFFNVFLFVLLAVIFLYRSIEDIDNLIIPCFLLVTSQLWYIFSYCNNDAFALFVSVLLAYELSYKNSSLREFLSAEGNSAKAVGGIMAGLLFGLLIICKPNYWVFLLFSAAWLLVCIPFNFQIVKKYAVIGVIALSVFAFRVGLDFYVNGETNLTGASYINYFWGGYETKGGKLLAYQNEIADYEFKPSTLESDPLHSRPEVKLKAKGTTAIEMFTKWGWHKSSFYSFVGVYGYMNLLGPPWYYLIMFLLYSAFILYLAIRIFTSKNGEAIRQMAVAGAGAIVCAFISFYLSWNYAFQPQGRYLFPALPMLAMLIYSNRRLMDNIVVNAFIAACFLLSVYSFIFMGLAKIG